jgi:myo-inositol 2-dehydrogenase/D-chiro-inositol 1-dehydrogenase
MYFFLERYRDAYIEEMKQFIEACRNGSPSPLSGSEARKPVVIGKAALLSCRENRPVRIEEIQ